MKHRHPLALTPLFLTELWERFGFYIVQGMLIIYMTSALNFTDQHAYIVLGEFSALVYISPLVGGFFADRVLGYRYSILIGAILLGIGYGIVATIQHELLYWGLATVIMGNGFLKPNISTYLGEFYTSNDPRRDSGFTIFYMGINIGGMISTLSAGFIQQHFGWAATFGTASIGMVIAIISFVLGFNRFADYGLPPYENKNKSKLMTMFFQHRYLVSIIFILGILIAYFLLKYASLGNILQIGIGIALFFGLLYAATHYEPEERNRMFALIILITISIIFWGTFFQAFFSVNLFVERNVDRHLFGITVPPVTFISLEMFFIIILGAPFAHLWQKLNRSSKKPSISLKFACAMFAMSAAMLLLVFAINHPLASGLIHPSWLVGFYLLLTVGEMLLSPIGLSMVTELAPSNVTGLMMGVWFLSLGFGGTLAGDLAEQADIPHYLTNLSDTNTIYQHAFFNYSMIAFAAGILLLFITPWIKKLIKS